MGALPKAQPARTPEQIAADRLNLATALKRTMGQLESATRTGRVLPVAREVMLFAQRTLRQAGCE